MTLNLLALRVYSRRRPAEGATERRGFSINPPLLTCPFRKVSSSGGCWENQNRERSRRASSSTTTTPVFTIGFSADLKEKSQDWRLFTFFSCYFHRVKPTFLEYLSYLLNFMSVIAGPCNNFKDYIAFIEGRHIPTKLLEVNWKQRGFHSLPEPSPTVSV